MALFDFLKGLSASERRELDETKQLVSSLKKEIESLRKAIPSIEGLARTSEIPSVAGFLTSKDLPDTSKFITSKDLPDLTGFALKADIPDTASNWKNQNADSPIKSATLFIGDKPDKAPDNQLTITV